MGVIVTPENIGETQCVAHVPKTKAIVYFEQWFLDQGFFDAPGYYYEVDGDRVITTRKKDGTVFIHILDELQTPYVWRNESGDVKVAMTRRGVWPD